MRLSPIAFIRFAFSLLISLIKAFHVLRVERPAAVITFGGYPSLPGGIAAFLLRIPVFVHEQNAIMGRVNRLLSRLSERLFLTWRGTKHVPAHVEYTCPGLPVRPAIAALAERPYKVPREKINLLILGGSLGAKIFSEVIPQAILALPRDLQSRLHITQQCRKEDLQETKEKYARSPAEIALAPFFENVPELLVSTHLVICRAGASTIAELTTAKIPAILIPYKGAKDDHQKANAEIIVNAKAGWMLEENEALGSQIALLLLKILGNLENLQEISKATEGFIFATSGKKLVDEVLDKIALWRKPKKI